MSEQQYELAFYGKLVEGSSPQQTKEQIAQLFKTGIEQIEKMFTGSRVVIRNKLDQETAMKYIVALQKRGAICQLELMGQPGIAVNVEADSNTAPPTPTPTPTTESESVVESETIPAKKTSTKASMSLNGLPIVGDKVDEILRATHFDLAPVGARLEAEKKAETIEHHALDDVSLAPVGSELVEAKEAVPVSVPDTTHIKLAPKD
jgi:hypothetical protein